MFNFSITEGMANAWKKRAAPRATPVDIAFMESNLGTRLPGDYIAFVMQYGFVDKLVPRDRYMTTTDDPDDENRPAIPPGYLPVGSDAGHSAILLDIAANPGQVWFWQFNDDRWGLGDNVALGFVADNFADFINSLQPDPL